MTLGNPHIPNVPNADNTEIMEQHIYRMAAAFYCLKSEKGPLPDAQNFHDNP